MGAPNFRSPSHIVKEKNASLNTALVSNVGGISSNTTLQKPTDHREPRTVGERRKREEREMGEKVGRGKRERFYFSIK